MRLIDVFPEDDLFAAQLAEGPLLKKIMGKAAAGALATGLAMTGVQGLKSYNQHAAPTQSTQPTQRDQDSQELDKLVKSVDQQPAAAAAQVLQTARSPKLANISKNVHEENMLKKAAANAGITGVELAAFLSQCNHESADFERMHERGGRRYFLRKYDPKFAPKTAARLGNTEKGDGARYYGRGFIQLTGRDNYSRAGDALGIDLEDKPELASRPDIAVKVAVWYWLHRVRPKVSDFSDVAEVTHAVNSKETNIDARAKSFAAYQRMI